MAYQNGVVGIHAKVKVRKFIDENDTEGHRVESTVGRFIFNQGLPQDMGFVNRKKDPYGLEIDFLCGKKQLDCNRSKCGILISHALYIVQY